MALQSIINVEVDFYDKKYILINAKQYDKNSRFLSVTCYNHGELYPMTSSEHSAYIRYKKSDNYSVFNFCEINYKGKILVELTEQMLASDGICSADLVIANKGSADVDTETGEIVAIDNAAILSTMPLYIDVTETAVENSDIESSYEYNGLNDLMERAEAEYSQVIRLAKSYAHGGTDERVDEDTDNAKYYYEQSKKSAASAESYMNSASNSATAASKSAVDANTSAQNAQAYMGQAKVYMDNAKASSINAQISEINAAASETSASNSANVSQSNMTSASNSAASASVSATNAKNYYLQAEAIVSGLNGAFLPKGTITFAELSALKESGTLAAGYLYNISDDFVTDNNFRCGAGISYEAGTNVYYTADGQFDCLAGATVTGVKGDMESVYRKGNVNITAENVGAVSINDMATIDEVKAYLGII